MHVGILSIPKWNVRTSFPRDPLAPRVDHTPTRILGWIRMWVHMLPGSETFPNWIRSKNSRYIHNSRDCILYSFPRFGVGANPIPVGHLWLYVIAIDHSQLLYGEYSYNRVVHWVNYPAHGYPAFDCVKHKYNWPANVYIPVRTQALIK